MKILLKKKVGGFCEQCMGPIENFSKKKKKQWNADVERQTLYPNKY